MCRYAYVGINEGLYLIISYDIFCCSLPAGSACRNEAAFCPPLAPISCRLMKAKRARNARNEHNSAYIQHNEPMQANVCHRLDMFLDTQRSHHVVMWHAFFRTGDNCFQMLQHGKVLKERFFSRSLRCCR